MNQTYLVGFVTLVTLMNFTVNMNQTYLVGFVTLCYIDELYCQFEPDTLYFVTLCYIDELHCSFEHTL